MSTRGMTPAARAVGELSQVPDSNRHQWIYERALDLLDSTDWTPERVAAEIFARCAAMSRRVPGREVQDAVRGAEAWLAGKPKAGFGGWSATPMPRRPKPRFDQRLLRRAIAGTDPESAAPGWWRARSPVPIPKTPEGQTEIFLRSVFAPGERVFVTDDQRRRGGWIWTHPGGGWKPDGNEALFEAPRAQVLAFPDRPGTPARQSRLPERGKNGVLFLSNPVLGRWVESGRTPEGNPARSLRSQPCVTAWRHLVLESDEPEAAPFWLRWLASSGLPLAAVYSSGGKSWHALVRVEAADKGEMDRILHAFKRRAVPFGADPAALTAVRLSRLPGCFRGGSLQQLIFLNPEPATGFSSGNCPF